MGAEKLREPRQWRGADSWEGRRWLPRPPLLRRRNGGGGRSARPVKTARIRTQNPATFVDSLIHLPAPPSPRTSAGNPKSRQKTPLPSIPSRSNNNQACLGMTPLRGLRAIIRLPLSPIANQRDSLNVEVLHGQSLLMDLASTPIYLNCFYLCLQIVNLKGGKGTPSLPLLHEKHGSFTQNVKIQTGQTSGCCIEI